MRKLLTLIASLAILSFAGCSSSSATPDAKSGLEGTEVSTYLVGDYMETSKAKSKLEAAGFEVIASYKSVKKGTTLVFTNAALKAEAAKPGRAYAAVSRLFIDEKAKMISFTNPVYFGKAFMQDDYNHAVFNGVLKSINDEFSGLKGSKDKLAFDDLDSYHFMMGMPYYSDPDDLGKPSATTAEAVAKANSYKKGKAVIFELKLSETSTLLGYDLGKRTKKFVKKIGRANGAILPWCVSIENGQAKALNAKYYIALSYPLLDMGGFMGIATVPGAITKDLEKAFKK
jgi:hypothetical protein